MRIPLQPLLCAGIWSLGCGLAAAQAGAAGSESHLSSARNLPAAAGSADSANYVAEVELAFASGGAPTSSENYRFRGGAVWTGTELSPSGPLVFGFADAVGDKDGGETRVLSGLGFQAPGAGAPSVSLGGANASAVNVLSDTELSLVTPAGVDAFGNPLARVDVALTNGLGTSTAADAFVYTPALQVPEAPRVGSSFEIELHAGPLEFQDLYYGLPIPGFALPVAGIDGAFDLLAFNSSPVSFAPSGGDITTWTLPVPATPTLVGQSIDWQAFSLDGLAPLSGSFTNRITTTFTD